MRDERNETTLTIGSWWRSSVAYVAAVGLSAAVASAEPARTRRPKAFDPVHAYLLHASGFVTSGCFDAPGDVVNGAVHAVPGLPPGALVDGFEFGWVHTQHPPLTPEECEMLERSAEPAALKTKKDRWETGGRELTFRMGVGSSAWRATEFTLQLHVSGGTEQAYEMTVTQADFATALPVPWARILRPVAFTSTLVETNPAEGRAPRTAQCAFRMGKHQGRDGAFGTFAVSGEPPRFVMGKPEWGGRGYEPGWERWRMRGAWEGTGNSNGNSTGNGNGIPDDVT